MKRKTKQWPVKKFCPNTVSNFSISLVLLPIHRFWLATNSIQSLLCTFQKNFSLTLLGLLNPAPSQFFFLSSLLCFSTLVTSFFLFTAYFIPLFSPLNYSKVFSPAFFLIARGIAILPLRFFGSHGWQPTQSYQAEFLSALSLLPNGRHLKLCCRHKTVQKLTKSVT